MRMDINSKLKVLFEESEVESEKNTHETIDEFSSFSWLNFMFLFVDWRDVDMVQNEFNG